MARRRKPKTVMMRVRVGDRDFIKDFAKKQGKSIPEVMRMFRRRMK